MQHSLNMISASPDKKVISPFYKTNDDEFVLASKDDKRQFSPVITPRKSFS